jgi:RNA polymerase sigma-70 factor (ECF subfamily)
VSAGPSDAVLAARAAAGDDLAFGALVARHRPALVRTAASRLGHFAAEAEDVVQDALGRAHAHLRGRGVPENVVAWLHTIVRNRAIDVVRHHPGRRGVQLEDHDVPTIDGPEAIVARRERIDAVMTAIGDLPGRQREALVDVVFSGASYEQVAASQATSVPAVKALVNRARRSVRTAAAALLPLPGLLRSRLWFLAGHAEPGAAVGLIKGCSTLAVIGTLSLAVAPQIEVPLHPANDGSLPHAPRLSTRQVDAIASTTRRHQDGQAASRAPAVDAAIAACAADRPLAGVSPADLRQALRTMPDDVAEYSACAPHIRAALRATM